MRAEGDDAGIPAGDRLTVAEMHDSIETISEADTARLETAAQGFSRIRGVEADDLLQEAITRTLEGERTCKRGVPLVSFICGVMKSLVSEEIEARKKGLRPTAVLRNGEPILPDAPTGDPSPERAAISAIDHRATLTAIEAAAVGDEKVQLLIEGIYDKMRGAELQQLLDVDEKSLAAVRKRFSRLLLGLKPRIAS
jgi:DNA-directed RNA polymerase specialized sigma24 family protein